MVGDGLGGLAEAVGREPTVDGRGGSAAERAAGAGSCSVNGTEGSTAAIGTEGSEARRTGSGAAGMAGAWGGSVAGAGSGLDALGGSAGAMGARWVAA